MSAVVCRCLGGVVGGVHVLPFYPSSADRGFAPLTYKQVDPSFGDWEDIAALREDLDVCVDFMVNHISAQSPQFQDFVEKGDKVPPPSPPCRTAAAPAAEHPGVRRSSTGGAVLCPGRALPNRRVTFRDWSCPCALHVLRTCCARVMTRPGRSEISVNSRGSDT